jgi:CoA:oxalate CoA-transferase
VSRCFLGRQPQVQGGAQIADPVHRGEAVQAGILGRLTSRRGLVADNPDVPVQVQINNQEITVDPGTGRGQIVDTSLLEAMIGVLSWGAGMFFERGSVPGPAGQHHPLSAPYGRFRAKDGYLNIAAGKEAMWQKLADALEHPEWKSEARFQGPLERLRNRDALTGEMEAALAASDVAHWVDQLNRAGVPCGPVLDLGQVFSDPQVLARQMLVELPHKEVGTFKTTGLPVKLSETPGAITRPPPLHGEHSDEVLREAGFGDAEIEALREQGVVGARRS